MQRLTHCWARNGTAEAGAVVCQCAYIFAAAGHINLVAAYIGNLARRRVHIHSRPIATFNVQSDSHGFAVICRGNLFFLALRQCSQKRQCHYNNAYLFHVHFSFLFCFFLDLIVA